jgi:hypothetical protein
MRRTMTDDERIATLDQAIALTTDVRNSLAAPTPPAHDVIDITPGQSVQSALDAAAPGAWLRIAPGTYEGALRIVKAAHFVPLHPPANGQATADQSVWLTSGADATVLVTHDADDVTFLGLGLRNHNAAGEWATVQGSRVLFDRCTGLGDDVHGQHRGWRLEGRQMRLVHCYADDVFLPGRDSSVIGSWQDCDGLEIDKCYLRGGAETVMFGGADAPAADRMPKNIRLTSSTLTHDPAWYAMGAQLKTPFELKCVQGLTMSDCLLEYGGVAEGQGAYLMVLTVRNQDGAAPWSIIEDVVIERCLCRYGGGGVNVLGRDNVHPSGTMRNVTIRDCQFTGLNPQGLWSQGGYYGSGRCTLFGGAPHGVTFDGITFDGSGMSALGYFLNAPEQPTALTLRNWKYCPTEYGWIIDADGMDVPPASANLHALMPDLVYEITATDPGAAAPAAMMWRAPSFP